MCSQCDVHIIVKKSHFQRSKMKSVELPVFKKHVYVLVAKDYYNICPNFHVGAVFTVTRVFRDDVGSQTSTSDPCEYVDEY